MRKGNQRLCLTILSLMAALGSTARATSFEYDWLTNMAGFSGKIFLDASSGSNGTLADVDLANSYITTPDGTFSFTTANPFNSATPIAWNASQILTIDIEGSQPLISPAVAFWAAKTNRIGDDVYLTGAVQQLISSQADVTGRWVAAGTSSSVPDNPNSAFLLGGALLLTVSVWQLTHARVISTKST